MVDVFGAPRNSFPGAPRSSFTLLPLSLLKLRMSLDQNLDLALIGYQELIGIAERKSLDSPSSLARPELVQALRKQGVGVKPVTDTGTSWINDSKLDSLANTIQALAGEIASMREDRESIILFMKLEISELKGEVQQLHQQQHNGSSKPVHCDTPDMQSRCTRTVSTNSTQPSQKRMHALYTAGQLALLIAGPPYLTPTTWNAGTYPYTLLEMQQLGRTYNSRRRWCTSTAHMYSGCCWEHKKFLNSGEGAINQRPTAIPLPGQQNPKLCLSTEKWP